MMAQQITPLLSAKHRKMRLDFAISNLKRDWRHVIFSDELSIGDICNKPANPCAPYQPIEQNLSTNFQVWGWIGLDGPGQMKIIPARMSSLQYTELLRDVLIPSVKCVGDVILFQDNNPTHTSLYTRNWFANHPEVITLMPPPRSPDLNLCGNFWWQITRNFTSVDPLNQANLEPTIVSNWEKFDDNSQYFKDLYDSMPHRMIEIIRNDGGPTLYF